MDQKAPSRSGFTIIEILIVIAIVAVILALVLPSLSLMRERGRAARCLSNLQQSGLVTFGIIEERDGLYPFWVPNVPPSPPIKRQSMAEVYGDRGVNLDIFVCPSDPSGRDAPAGYTSYRYWPGEEMQRNIHDGPDAAIRDVTRRLQRAHSGTIMFDRNDWHDGKVHANFIPEWRAGIKEKN